VRLLLPGVAVEHETGRAVHSGAGCGEPRFGECPGVLSRSRARERVAFIAKRGASLGPALSALAQHRSHRRLAPARAKHLLCDRRPGKPGLGELEDRLDLLWRHLLRQRRLANRLLEIGCGPNHKGEQQGPVDPILAGQDLVGRDLTRSQCPIGLRHRPESASRCGREVVARPGGPRRPGQGARGRAVRARGRARRRPREVARLLTRSSSASSAVRPPRASAGRVDQRHPASRRNRLRTSDRAWTRAPGLVFSQCSLGEPAAQLLAAPVGAQLAVAEHVFDAEAAVGADATVGDLAAVEQAHQEWPRDAEDVSRPLGSIKAPCGGPHLGDSELRGKAKGEAGSVRRRVAGQVAVVLVGDPLGDREAEAVAGFAGVESDEAFEDALAFVFGYAGPSSATPAWTYPLSRRSRTSIRPVGWMAARALSIRLRRTRSSASGSPRTVASSSALSEISARGERVRASSTSGRAIVARSTGVRVGCASRRANPSRSLTRRPSRSLSRATAAWRRSRSGRSGCSRRRVSTLACRAATGVRSSWEAEGFQNSDSRLGMPRLPGEP